MGSSSGPVGMEAPTGYYLIAYLGGTGQDMPDDFVLSDIMDDNNGFPMVVLIQTTGTDWSDHRTP